MSEVLFNGFWILGTCLTSSLACYVSVLCMFRRLLRWSLGCRHMGRVLKLVERKLSKQCGWRMKSVSTSIYYCCATSQPKASCAKLKPTINSLELGKLKKHVARCQRNLPARSLQPPPSLQNTFVHTLDEFKAAHRSALQDLESFTGRDLAQAVMPGRLRPACGSVPPGNHA